MIKSFLMWLVNIVLKVLIFKKRDTNLWLFGAWGGDAYCDNSKYLFEYVSKNFPQINAVWITKNESIKSQLHNMNMKCYLYNEVVAQKLRLTAKYIFFTNGINDIGDYDLSQGSIKIALWHGMPLKKLLYATNNIQNKNKNLIRFLQYIYLKIYNSSQRTISIATSDLTKELLIRSFEVESNTILITGQPRNDILFNLGVSTKIRSALKHKSNEKFVLYMPTWREFGQNDIFLDDIIDELNKDTIFSEQLIKEKIKLYIKPHPRISINTKSEKNIIVLDKLAKIDSQKLISSADILITDYSSVFIDYALLERPIYFYVPDLEEYKRSGNDLFLSFDEFTNFIISDITLLKEVIIKHSEYKDQGLENSKKINTIFDDAKLQRGHYCKHVINTMIDEKIILLKENI